MNVDILKIGHRGAAGHVAENTLESIKKAMEYGATGIEIDVHLCASGELVVFHDFTLGRVTNGTGDIADKNLSELKALKVFGKYQIPTLKEVIDSLDKDMLLNIELKGENTAKPVSELIDFYVENKGWKWRNFLVSSFQTEFLQIVYNTRKPIMLGVLTDTNLDDAMQFAHKVNAVAIHADYTMLTKKHVKKIQTLNYQVMAYTVNDSVSIEKMKAFGVDGIISDFPDKL